jgi:hypothetical protein
MALLAGLRVSLVPRGPHICGDTFPAAATGFRFRLRLLRDQVNRAANRQADTRNSSLSCPPAASALPIEQGGRKE